MPRHTPSFALCAALSLIAGCATSTGSGVPTVPDSPPATAAQIPALVGGGPYDLTIYDGAFAGTTGTSTWDFERRVVFGTFTDPDGNTGEFETPIRLDGDLLCTETETASLQCHQIVPVERGFLEVNEDGSLHAASLRG